MLIEGEDGDQDTDLNPGGDGDGQGDKDNTPPGDDQDRDPKGRWVPKVRMDEVLVDVKQTKEELQREREARIRLEEQVAALKDKKTADQKVYSRVELRKMVEDGEITQEHMDDYLEQKLRAEIKAEISTELKGTETQREFVAKIKADLGRYKEAVPEVLKEGSEERKKVTDEYQYLIGLGHPANVQTELAALRAAFGPIDKVEKRRMSRQERESFQDQGGGGGGGGKKPAESGKQGELTKNLPQRYKDHYQALIDKGMYRGWEDPRIEKELKRVSPDVYQRRAKKAGA